MDRAEKEDKKAKQSKKFLEFLGKQHNVFLFCFFCCVLWIVYGFCYL